MRSVARVFAALALISVASGAHAANKNWLGNPGNWSNGLSWTDLTPAQALDQLNFNNVTFPSPVNANNDTVAGNAYGPITITSTNGFYDFTGNTITLLGNISSAPSNNPNHQWAIPVALNSGAVVTFSGSWNAPIIGTGTQLTLVAAPAGPFIFNGAINTGANLLIGPSPQLVKFNSTSNAYANTFVLSGAALEVASLTPLPGNTQVDGRLSGNIPGGSAGNVVTSGGGVVAPGAFNGTSPGTLGVNSLTLGGGTLEIQLGPSTVDLVGAQSVNLTGGSLNVLLGPGAFSGGNYQIINNAGGSPVTGTFNGLPQGQPFFVNDNKFAILYNAGDGNDVAINVVAAARHWTGAGGTPFWNNPSNWAEGATPFSGCRVIFPAGAPTSTINDIPGIVVDAMLFGGPGYVVDGGTIGVQNGIDSGGNSVTINAPLDAVAAQTWTLRGTLGPVNIGPNTLTLNATGDINFGTSSIGGTGLLAVGSGVTARVFVANVAPPAVVSGSARLTLSAGVGAVTVNGGGAAIAGAGAIAGNLAVAPTNFLSPGSPNSPTPGIFNLTSPPGPGFRVSIAGGAIYLCEAFGATIGQYDRLDVAGTVNVSGANLNFNLMYPAVTGTQFTIIANDSTDPIAGFFSGFAEGTVFSSGGQPVKISYVGGDGNDVVITRLSSPSITSVSPGNGRTAGGDTVTITGSDFQPGAVVTFAGSPASIVSNSPTSLTVTTPPGVSGPVTLKVMNPDGQQALSVFTYNGPFITPPLNPTSGTVGQSVIVTGDNLNSVDTVLFGGVSASFTIQSAMQLTATVPAGAPAGSIPLVVVSNGNSSSALFTRITTPTVSNVTPGNGPTNGGFLVTISGNDFASPTVTFGGTTASIVTSSTTSITVNAPAHVSGPVTVRVTNNDSQFADGAFTYNAPFISSLTPNSGSVGNTVIIDGSSLNLVSSVTFGGVSASFTIISGGTQIQATVPTIPPGPALVVVTSGPSTSNPASFNRIANPTITNISPANGTTGGGDTVTISGTEFLSGATVTVNGVPASITTLTATQIVITTPPGISGPASVQVTNPDSSIATSLFTYNSPAIGGISSPSGIAGASIVVTGTSLTGVDTVTFGGVSATFTIQSDTQLTATVPAAAPAGSAPIVASSNGFSSTPFAFQRLTTPSISSVTPNSGPTTGGISVTAGGNDFLSPTVTVGGNAATVTSSAPKSVTFTLPPGTSGPAQIKITNSDGQFAVATFNYDTPVITTINPTQGGVGSTITITGTSLNTVSSVMFGVVSASFTVVSGTQINATVPNIPPGTANVSVVSGAQPSNALPFTRLSNPTITNVAPPNGPTNGGILITVSGNEFMSGAQVTVGATTVPASVNSPTSLTFTLPAGSSGPKPLLIANPDGQSVSGTFTYNSPAITTLSPSSGAVGATVIITGTSLNSVDAVSIGSMPATFTVLSPTQIQATVPAIPPGNNNVVVSSGVSFSNTLVFQRISVPTIGSISPTSGPTGGNITITVNGTELLPGATVTVGGNPATVLSATGNQVTFTLPAGSSGSKQVVVKNTDGQSATTTFTYNSPSITGLSATSGIVGASLNINGTSLSSVTSVTFNGVAATFTVVNDGQLQVTVPNLPPGNATIVVSSGSFASNSTAFTVTCPSLTVAISGPTATCAGDSVTLTATPSSTPVTYLWSSGATTQSITVSGIVPSVTYSVTVTSPTGCTATASYTVNASNRTTLNIDAPTLVSNGATATARILNPPSGASTFTWSIANGTIVSGQGTPTLTFTAGASGNVSLSVNAPTGACTSSGSVSIPIQVCATTPPTLIGPAEGATSKSPVNFGWTAVPNAIGYEVWAGSDTASAVLVATSAAPGATVSLASGPTSWFVIARLATTCSPNALQSATGKFTVEAEKNCPTAAPAIVSPSGSTHVFSPITLKWSGVKDATGYNVSVRSTAGDTQDLGNVSATTTQITAQLTPGDYTWFVSAIYDGCPPIASQGGSFTVDREDCSTHIAATLSSPSNGSTLPSAAVTFKWTAVPGADGYRVWTANLTTGEQESVLGETNDTMFSANLEPGNIRWFIETTFKGCPSTNSVKQTFVVPKAIDCSKNVAPSLVSPSNGILVSDANVTFSWSNVGAVQYEVYLSVNSGTPALAGRTTGTNFTAIVPQGTIDWFVRALFNGCPTLQSQTSRFVYQPAATCVTDRPILIAPQNESVPIPSPVTFRWSRVPGASGYRLLIVSTSGSQLINATDSQASVAVASGPASWSVTAVFPGTCPATDSAVSQFVVVATPSGCIDLTSPIIAAPSQISDNVPYFVQWQPVVGATSYILQRSTSGTFETAGGTPVNDTQASFNDRNAGSDPLTVFYRVRAVSNKCTPVSQGPFSAIVGVVILPAVQSSTTSEGSTLAAASQTIMYSIPLGSELAGATFSATPTAPWISVSPSSGVIPAGGISLNVTANPNGLPVGTSAGNVIVTLDTPAAATKSGLKRASNGSTKVTVPVSVNKVTPVAPNPKSAPPPDALIIPAVAHADGINSKFESDIRITNTSAQVVKYQLTFTPTGDSGISDGRQATVDIEPGRTMALDDVLKSWFGTGTGSALGTLEIRPLTKTAASTSSAAVKGLQNFSTFASSRTFNLTTGGTFGQYIPAIPYANFIGSNAIISMQQIAQSDAYRTNLGFVEGSGEPASLLVSVFGDKGQKLTDFDVFLNGGQHLQLGSILAQKNLQVNDGRIEVKVTSVTGKVSAYASVLDNKTNDSLLVTPITLGDTGNTRYVLPGVAELSGGIPWRSDMRLFNAGDKPVTATLTFRSLGATAPQSIDVQLEAKEVKQFDRVLNSVFGITNDGGALSITTATASNLIATARTYRPATSGGSFGQFISAITPNEAVASGTRPLQILQVEESPRFRSNIGIVEVTGKPVTVEVTAIPPDSKAVATIRVPMDANQVRQLNSLLAQMGLSDTHNARVTVRVVEGDGRVTAYASVIDAQTADPTYVPAQ